MSEVKIELYKKKLLTEFYNLTETERLEEPVLAWIPEDIADEVIEGIGIPVSITDHSTVFKTVAISIDFIN